MSGPTRRLAAIWFADVAGFTKLSATDEPLALLVMNAMRDSVRTAVGTQHGTLIKFLGDGALAEFPSAEGAVEAALEASARFKGATRPLDGGPYKLHIGIHVGDVAVASDGDIFGDGVNRAARLQALAEPGQTLVSEDVFRSMRRGLEFQFTSLGERTAKGLDEPFVVYQVEARGAVLGRLSLIERESRPHQLPIAAAQTRATTRTRAIATGMAAAVVTFIGLGVWTAMGGTATHDGIPAVLAPLPADPRYRLPPWPEPTASSNAPAPTAATMTSNLIVASLASDGTDATDGPAAGAQPFNSLLGLAARANDLFRELRDPDLSAHETLPLLRAATDAIETSTAVPAQAHAARGLLLFVVGRDAEGAESAFLQALSADPSSGPARRMFAQLLTAQGRFGEAHFQVNEAKASLPPGAYEAARGAIFLREGQFENAETALKRAIDRNQDAISVRILLARALIQRGNESNAIDILNEAVGSISVTPWVAYAQLHQKAGNLTDAERTRFADLAGRSDSGMVGALIFLELGQVDRAMQVLDRRLAAGDADLLWLAVDPEWAPMRENQQLMRRVVKVFES